MYLINIKENERRYHSRLHSGRTFGLQEPSAWQYLSVNHDDDDDDVDDGDLDETYHFLEGSIDSEGKGILYMNTFSPSASVTKS